MKLDPQNAPCLIFCNTGRLRTCVIVGCLRQIQGWSLASTMAEFDMFSCREGGVMDMLFIENFKKVEAEMDMGAGEMDEREQQQREEEGE
jgi:hypothetical protein